MRMTKKLRNEILAKLAEEYSNTKTALQYSTPFELMIAVVLSAQCTDDRVNIITRRLFPAYNTPSKMLALGQAGLESLIRDCGLFRSKAKNILTACEILCRNYGEEIPASYDELIKLPGVGRKTANVLLSELYNVPAIAVDTHVFRVANRLKLAQGDTPEQVEKGLMNIISRDKWGEAHHWLIWHGRKVCKARRPDCDNCIVANLCPSINSEQNAAEK